LVKVFDNQNSRSFTLQCDINKRQSTPTRIKKKLRKKNKTTIDSFANSNQFLSEVSTPLTIGMKTLYRAATITLIDRSTTKKIARFSFPVTTMPHKQLVGGGGQLQVKKNSSLNSSWQLHHRKLRTAVKLIPSNTDYNTRREKKGRWGKEIT
jgi:hypothetical protein